MRYLIFIFTLSAFSAYGQLDSVVLKGVNIYGIPVEKYAVGQKVLTIGSEELHSHSDENLATLLNQKASIYMKMYGNNMSSTIAFRGTGPNHTAVFWNGLEISSITLGQTDFSLLPVYAADKIGIHYGASSSLYGSGAIGGAITMQSLTEVPEGLGAEITSSYGSFNTLQEGAKLTFSGGQIGTQTKVYYTESSNDFEYTLPSSGEKLNQKNAAYRQYGLQQDVNVKLSSNQRLTFNGWFASNYREIQPVIGNLNNDDKLEDRNLRLTASYHNNSSVGYFVYRLAYLNDWQLYNENSEIETDRIINKLKFERKLSNSFSVQSGISWNHIKADVNNYESSEKEQRVSAFALLKYAKQKIDLSFNARQTFVTGYNTPIAPSFGFEYRLAEAMSLTGQLSRNYRVPTLNDRFWVPGGNEDVQPEEAYNAEIGANYTPIDHLKLAVNYYKMWVDDWIIWLPQGGVWSPQNINKVNSEGVEASIAYILESGNLKINTKAEYALSEAVVKETFDSNKRSVGKQLPYTPRHTAAFNTFFEFLKWGGFARVSYTGERFTESNNTLAPLEDFVLIDLGLSRSFNIGKSVIKAGFKVNNVAGEDYQTLRNRAMPKRNFSININFKFHQILKKQS